MALTFENRMNNLEALAVKVSNDVNNLATDDELDAIVTQIFDDIIGDLTTRIAAAKNTLDIVERTISITNG